ncbi:Ig-like domain-containing protein, partial [bacterium]|nr:Ig-like domain-containing protein [bacterium]
ESASPYAPVVGLPLTFISDMGSISPREVESDGDGQAIAALTSEQNSGVAIVRVEYRTVIVDSVMVTFRALSLTLTSDQSSLLADGQATTQVTARLLNSEGNPVSGASVEFTTDLGSISSPHTTGEDGRATATLTSSTSPGTCNIVARFGSSVSDSLPVEFSSYDISVVAEPTSILADGVENSQITVVLRDGEGQPLSGESIELATDLGEISPQVLVTDAGGSGQAFLTSLASSVDTQAVVTVTFRESSNQVSVSMRGIQISLSADPTTIVANGTSAATVTANLQETTSDLPLSSRKVVFETNLGTITEEVLTNSWGQATATLLSDVFSGTATVTVHYGATLTQSTQVEFLTTDVNQVSLETGQDELLADGESQTTLTATVTDADDQPIENVAVSFECQTGTITPLATTNSLGQAKATFTSPPAVDDQAVSFSASVGSVAGETAISLKGVTFSITGLEQEVLADGVSTTTVIAEIKETTSGL